jgi:energy-coupling factor transporter ATP-binding protein EcfA2
MESHYISSIHVSKLWGDKNIKFKLHPDVNVIIGPNASGKTTIINLLMYSLTGNVIRLMDYQFKFIHISLKAFDGVGEIEFKVTKTEEEIRFEIGNKIHAIPLFPGSVRSRFGGLVDVPPDILRRHFGTEIFELKRELEGLVPAAWLPVSRRIPISDEDEPDRRNSRRNSLESVDECLSELLDGLQKYRVSLDSKLAELRKEFQKHALENILYDKKHDRMIDWQAFQSPTEDDKQQLLKAFHDVGFVDRLMAKRVDEHFHAAQEAVEEMKKNPTRFTNQTIFIIPLLHRTKQMIEFAQDLEAKRKELFSPLALYEKTVGEFIKGKSIRVAPRGDLDVSKDTSSGQKGIQWRHLSSGEKQVLILLTQALLWEKYPVVYVADEPELSLHVVWQEKLLSSLRGCLKITNFPNFNLY